MRTRALRMLVALTACLALAASLGCAQSMVAGVFVNRDNPREVAMLHLVESPRGHLTGSFVISSLNANGSRRSDASYDVAGTITGSNVSLQFQNPLVGLAEIFGAPTNLVGSLTGRTLTLSVGNQTEVLHEVSEKQYGDALASLDNTGQHIAMVVHANSAAQEFASNEQQLNADLKKYIAWGQERVNHVPRVRQWYADRTTRYTKCLQTIRPLAAQRVPSWRWQDCVLAIQTDEYDRNQETQSIQDAQGQNRDTIADLDKRIDAARQQLPKLLDEIKSACPYTKDIAVCEKTVQKLNSLPADGFLDSGLVASYRSIVPQVNSAISADVQVAATGLTNLVSLAQQVEKVYNSAR